KAIIAIVAVIAVVVVTAVVVIERRSAPPVTPATVHAPAHATSSDAEFYSGKVDNSGPTKGY
ncbi:MAG: hypothetical protein PHI71_10795, partial [Acidiphilium sp.]|nr:hypothetical protein [Acidiphilium sp.]